MIIRILLAVTTRALAERLKVCLPAEDVLVAAVEEPAAFWVDPGEEPCDLVIADPGSLNEPLAESVAALRTLPEQTELVAIVPSEDPEQRARLQAAGALAVIYERLDDAALAGALAGIVERLRTTSTQRVKVEEDRQGVCELRDFSSASPAMKGVLKLAERVANSDSSLLILGETGTGKEWLARAVHSASRRSARPFVALNCAAVPDTLLESELFGHERGAFTGAHRARRGYFELAHLGTLFLDEIGEMPAALQAKLLRVLEDRQVRRIGSEQAFEVDVRIMAATHRDPESAILSGALRRDLYFRLAVVALELPALRARREDILSLFENHVEQFRAKLARWEVTGTAADAQTALLAYGWPGNVRELINVAERAVLLCEHDEITLADLPPAISDGYQHQPAGEALVTSEHLGMTLADARQSLLDRFESHYLRRLLEETGGNVGRTARRAGIDPRTLYNKMKAYGLRKEDFRRRAKTE